MSGLKPCPFCGGGENRIEPKGQVWSGVKGYSKPQWFEFTHWCAAEDKFLRPVITLKAHTEAQLAELWNTRADDKETDL